MQKEPGKIWRWWSSPAPDEIIRVRQAALSHPHVLRSRSQSPVSTLHRASLPAAWIQDKKMWEEILCGDNRSSTGEPILDLKYANRYSLWVSHHNFFGWVKNPARLKEISTWPNVKEEIWRNSKYLLDSYSDWLELNLDWIFFASRNRFWTQWWWNTNGIVHIHPTTQSL